MKKVLVLLCVLAMTGIASADVLTDNGVDAGFESSFLDGNGWTMSAGYGTWTEWWNWGNIYFGTEPTAPGPAADITAHSGSGYFGLTGGGPGDGGTAPIVVSAAVPATAGYEYTFGAWLRTNTADIAAPVKVEMGFDQLQDGGWQGNDVFEITLTDEWTYYEVSTFAWHNGIAPKIANFAGTDPLSTQLFTDDWTLVETVPEPATMALLGLGALVLRRKK